MAAELGWETISFGEIELCSFGDLPNVTEFTEAELGACGFPVCILQIQEWQNRLRLMLEIRCPAKIQCHLPPIFLNFHLVHRFASGKLSRPQFGRHVQI